jgi:hypothetical protein
VQGNLEALIDAQKELEVDIACNLEDPVDERV